MAAETPGPEPEETENTDFITTSEPKTVTITGAERADVAAAKLASTPEEDVPFADTPDEVRVVEEVSQPEESTDQAEPAPGAERKPPFDQYENETPEERGQRLARELHPTDITDPEAAAKNEDFDASYRQQEADKQREVEAARTRIDEVDLAHEMGNIVNKEGYDKAQEHQDKAAEKAAKAEAKGQSMADAQIRSARAYRSRWKNEMGAQEAEARAEDAKFDAAAKVERVTEKGDERAKKAMDSAWEKAEATKDAYVEARSQKVIKDPEIAFSAAYAEKGPREQAMTVEQQAEALPENDRERARLDGLAVDLRKEGKTAGKEAAKAEEERLDAVDQAVNKQIIEASGQINQFAGAKTAMGMMPIGVNEAQGVTPDMVEKISSTLLTSYGVDFNKPSYDDVLRGPRLFGPKIRDIYYQSENPALANVVFVERRDNKTNELLRLDAVSVPRPPKPVMPEPKEGKYRLGRVDRLRWRAAERQWETANRLWRPAIEAKLEAERNLPSRASAAEPFLPDSYAKTQARVGSHGFSGGVPYASTLQRRGVSADRAAELTKAKPKRRGNWFLDLFR